MKKLIILVLACRMFPAAGQHTDTVGKRFPEDLNHVPVADPVRELEGYMRRPIPQEHAVWVHWWWPFKTDRTVSSGKKYRRLHRQKFNVD